MRQIIKKQVRYYYLTLIFSLFISANLKAQSRFEGKVIDSKTNLPLEFANIGLYNSEDTVKAINEGITDLKGNFRFSNLSQGNYYIRVSFVGYGEKSQLVKINDDKFLLISLSPSITQINQVEVTGQRVAHHFNKTTYTIAPNEIKQSPTAFELLTFVPLIHIDKVNNSIASSMGGNVKVLINGLNSSEKDLLSIRSQDVLKIERYDFPPTQYAMEGYSAVINIITKKSAKGHSVLLGATNALFTGFGNDFISFKTNNSNSLFKIYYYQSYRNYKKRLTNTYYKYTINSNDYEKAKIGLESPFSYTEGNLEMEYVKRKQDNYTLQLRLTPSFRHSKNNQSQEINAVSAGDYWSGNSITTNKGHNFNPSIDIYLGKNLKHKQQLVLDLVGTHFHTKSDYSKIELKDSGDTTLNDENNIKGHKNSLILEGRYVKHLDSLAITLGVKHSSFFFNQNIDNSFGADTYHSNLYDDYAYAELLGQFKKFTYQLSLGASLNTYHEKTTDNDYVFWSFRPTFNLGYQLSQASNFKLQLYDLPEIPTLNQLSSNQFFIDDYVITSGNPSLKPDHINVLQLQYSHISQKLEVALSANISSVHDPILPYIIDEGNYLEKIEENQKSAKAQLLSWSFHYHPFKNNLLQLQFSGYLINERQKLLNDQVLKNQAISYSGSVSLYHDGFSLSTDYHNVYKTLNGDYLESNENYSTLMLSYRGGLAVGLFYPYSNSWHKSENTARGSLLDSQKTTRILDNGRMFVIQFGFKFDHGHLWKKRNKIINNKDSDSGALNY